MNESVAKTELIAVQPDGVRVMLTIEVGKPYLLLKDEDLEEWACPVSLRPLYNKLADARGGDSFQASLWETSRVRLAMLQTCC